MFNVKPVYTQYIFHTVTFIAVIISIGHLLKTPEFQTITFTPMAIYSAIAFLLFSIATSLINPRSGLTAVFTGRGVGNLMARRVFPTFIIIIFTTGYLQLYLYREGTIGIELGLAFLLLAFCIFTLIVVVIVSGTVNRASNKAKRATHNFKLMVEAAPFGIIMTDKEGTILNINKEAESVFGYTKKNLYGKGLETLVVKDIRDVCIERRTTFFKNPVINNQNFHEEVRALKSNEQEFPIEVVMAPIKGKNGNYLMLSYVTDLTRRKANEALITKQTTELRQKNEELEQFNYITSHDLQEPLRTVLNYIMMLEEDYPEQITGEVKEHLSVINSTVTRMNDIVRALLNFGKLGRGETLQAINTSQLLNEVIDDLNVLITENKATIIKEKQLPEIYGYNTELRQLFQNLINNSIKFSSKERLTNITISGKTFKDHYQFEIVDNGIGIAPENQEKIFDIFHRLHDTEIYDGHGIGLANCKKIVELHGGRIWVESTYGEGSTFIFTIQKLKPL
jgi:PAS domain S-box-containing protein